MRILYPFIIAIFVANATTAQSSTAALADTTIKTPVPKPVHNPHKATMHSLSIPGWGQAYNHEYWKLPIVYAAIGIPAGFYINSNNWYKRIKDAYTIVITNDTKNFDKINPQLISPVTGQPYDAATLQYYRNQYRQYRDYSLLAFIVAWGLNVVDATVFGHLKGFDVSDDLSLHVSPANTLTAKATNIGLVYNF